MADPKEVRFVGLKRSRVVAKNFNALNKCSVTFEVTFRNKKYQFTLPLMLRTEVLAESKPKKTVSQEKLTTQTMETAQTLEVAVAQPATAAAQTTQPVLATKELQAERNSREKSDDLLQVVTASPELSKKNEKIYNLVKQWGIINRIYNGAHYSTVRRVWSSDYSDVNAPPGPKKEVLLRSRFGNLYQYMDSVSLTEFNDVMGNIYNQLLIALDYWHNDLKVAHRDLKPCNVLVELDGTIRIIDLDSALEIEGTSTDSSITKSYLPPELIRAMFKKEKAPDNYNHIAQDAWALGVLLYRLLHRRGIIKKDLKYRAIVDNKNPNVALDLLSRYSSEQDLRSAFNSVDSDYAEFHEIIFKLLSPDWQERIVLFEQMKQESKIKSLCECSVETAPVHLFKFLMTPEAILNKNLKAVQELKAERRVVKDKLKSYPDKKSSQYASTEKKIHELSCKLARVKYEYLQSIFEIIFGIKSSDKSSIETLLVYDPVSPEPKHMSRMDGFIRRLLGNLLADSEIVERFSPKEGEPEKASFTYNNYPSRFYYHPAEPGKPEMLVVNNNPYRFHYPVPESISVEDKTVMKGTTDSCTRNASTTSTSTTETQTIAITCQ